MELQEIWIVIALTNGFHARTPFRAKTDRSALSITFTQSIDFIITFFPKTKA